ncbi:MAG: hypothetical protein M1826_003576 [Phylliscum demangeonii]|nr:MAG: hypothetical protein M1826_003576 [Phylliscum demangeonii]
MLLVRVLIAKVTSKSQLVQTLENVPIIQDDTSWTCRIWVRDALAALEADGRSLGTRVTDWSTVEEKTKWYVGLKEDQQRFDGSGQWDRTKAPTYDLLDGRETIA